MGTNACLGEGYRCSASSDCCGTLTCNSNGICTAGSCVGDGLSCSISSDCCGTLICSGGTCH